MIKFRVKDFPKPDFIFNSKTMREAYKDFYRMLDENPYSLFQGWVSRCKSCALHLEGNHVLPENAPTSKYVFMGRNPGKSESKYRRPFYPSAPSGRCLGEMLDRLHLKREACYITNALFCHGEKDRAPTNQERKICLLWKQAEFKYLTEMKYLFTLGNEAMYSLVGQGLLTISRAFGTVWKHKFMERTIYIIPLYHPSHLQRNPAMKNKTMVYLNGIREMIKELEK